MNKRLCLLLAIFILSFSSGYALAQGTSRAPWEGDAFSAQPGDIASAAAGIAADRYATVTILTQDQTVNIDASGRATSRYRLMYRVESDDALQWAGTVSETWSPWRQKKPEIRARVIAPDGSVSELDPKVLTDVAAHDQRPEIYQDQRTLSGPLPSVGVGSIVETESVVEDTAPVSDAGTLRRFQLAIGEPMQHALLVLQAPASLNLRYKVRGDASVKITRTEENGTVLVKFEQGPTPAVDRPEKSLPADADFASAIDYSTGASWNAVAADYYRTISTAIRPDEVGALLRGTTGLKGQQLLQKIVTNLHRQVRYTGLEFGSSALIPHAAGDTLKSGYGDCKDKAVVLVSALQKAGIPAELALLNTRGDSDVPPELAGIGLFDHAIVHIAGDTPTWIDATAEFHDPGDLPWGDQGRLALLVRNDTKDLVRTPVNTPDQNAQIAYREIFLQSYGPAKIVETSKPIGGEAAYDREEYGQADSKERREALERYVRGVFLAEGAPEMQHTAGDDLNTPFAMTLTVAKGNRAVTDMNSAVVAIRPEYLIYGYPNFVFNEPENDKGQARETKQRKNDAEFQPFVTEWHYKIVPPEGFGKPVLPKDSEKFVGPAKFTQQYKVAGDGTVEVLWRFDSVKARYTPDELQQLRRDANAVLSNGTVVIRFPEKGAALLAEGRQREAFAYYAERLKAQPNNSHYHLQAAKALMDAGFGEQAQKEGRRATELDPKDANTWAALADFLHHDALGRDFHAGFDRNGSIAAYRKAIELDPTDWTNYLNLGVTLEHDSSAVRYSKAADLEGAIAAYKELKRVDREEAEEYADNLLFAFLYAGKYDELLQNVSAFPATTTRHSLAVAAVAARDGSQAAIADAQLRGLSAENRSKVLVAAANLIIQLRRYPTGVDLLQAAVSGQDNASALQARIELLRNVRPYEEVLLPSSDPRRLVQDYVLLLLNPEARVEDFSRILVTHPADAKDVFDSESRAGRRLRNMVGADSSLTAARDIVLAMLNISMEGDERSGYRLRLNILGDTDTVLISKRENGFLMFTDQNRDMVGEEVLRRLAANDLQSAKQWLDWTREQLQANRGDDPLGGPILTDFWTRGDSADPAHMRLAALSLLSGSGAIAGYLPALKRDREAAADPVTAEKLDLLLMHSAWTMKDWGVCGEAGSRLLAAHPGSDVAMWFVLTSASHTKNWSVAQKVIDDRLARIPDDLTAIREQVGLAQSQGDFAQARKLSRSLIDSNRAATRDINEYTWDALFLGDVTDEDLSLMQRAITGDRNSSWGEVHTLACLYAYLGKTREARELLLRAMDMGGLEQPNDAIWLGLGLIAEQYGLNEVALSLYGKVEAEGTPTPGSNFSLARLREKVIQAGGSAHVAAAPATQKPQ